MIIHRISAQGFKIIGEKLTLELPDSGRIGIQGANESGKSTLLEAIGYALYGPRLGARVPREDVITWGKERARLELEFDSGSKRFLLTRELSSKGHKASLTPIVDGARDQRNAITSISEIESVVENETGMDSESFAKLIYIGQNDLDALRDFPKARREQLVDKIMGIDLLDGGIKGGKEAQSQMSDELEKLVIRLQGVWQNKALYVEKLSKRNLLAKKVEDSLPQLQELESNLAVSQGRLAGFEWLARRKALEDMRESKQSEFKEVSGKARQVDSLREQLRKGEAALAKFASPVNQLAETEAGFEEVERKKKDREGESARLGEESAVLLSQRGLSDSTSVDGLVKAKSTASRFFGVFLVAAVLTMASAFVYAQTAIASVVFFALSAAYYLRFRRVDARLASMSDLRAISKQLTGLRATLDDIERIRNQLEARTGFHSSAEVRKAVKSLSEELKSTTGQDTLEGLSAVIADVRFKLTPLEKDDPARRCRELTLELEGLDKEYKLHLEVKPHDADELSYSAEDHDSERTTCESLRTEASDIRAGITFDQRLLQVLDGDLVSLKPDFEAYPLLQQRSEDLSYKIGVQERAVLELSETAKSLRNQVIPHAKFFINKILPKMTNGRYSDFEIEEDFTFTVNAAGDYKSREVFSGGTQDQFLIALRLAFTQSILNSRTAADKYCLLMDECISSSDEFRQQAIFEVLNLAKETFPQILVIAHEDISNFVDYHLTLERNENGYASLISKSW